MAQGQGHHQVGHPAPPAADYLTLADWRRRVAVLYAEVRHLAAADPAGAHRRWRDARAALYRHHPQSPVPAHQRAHFEPRHFPYDPAWRFVLPVRPDPDAPPADLPASAAPGGGLAFRRIGWVDIPFPQGQEELALYWMEGYAGGLFLPFRDATAGHETYGGGRYLLDGAKGADLGSVDGALVLDFNFAFQPSCAFDARWACPLAGPESRLSVPVRAGERLDELPVKEATPGRHRSLAMLDPGPHA